MTIAATGTPRITELTVVPVAGQDSMLMNLSGAHGPWFTRNILVLKDSAGHVGVGEVPGGEAIRQTLEDARSLLVGEPIDVTIASVPAGVQLRAGNVIDVEILQVEPERGRIGLGWRGNVIKP